MQDFVLAKYCCSATLRTTGIGIRISPITLRTLGVTTGRAPFAVVSRMHLVTLGTAVIVINIAVFLACVARTIAQSRSIDLRRG